jgi:protein ImuB
MRVACVYVPELALQAVLRRDPERRNEPVALADGLGERARILAASPPARRAGVRPGLTTSQARAVSSGLIGSKKLVVVPQSAADTAAASAALADVGYAFAPRVHSEDCRLFLDVGELTRLFPEGERAIAQSIAAHAARVGLLVQVGIASSAAVARVAAQAAEIALVPPGNLETRAYLAPLRVETALEAGVPAELAGEVQEIGSRLPRWGITTLGAVAALPAGEVTVRLGRAGAWLHALAGGRAEELLSPRLPPSALEEGTELDYPLLEIEPLAFVLRGLRDRALARSSGRGLACAGLGLRLKLDPQGFDVREIPLSAPTRETATLLQLVRLDLERRPPPAPVVGLWALVLPARVRPSQLDLWRPAGPAPEKLAATVARLGALVGPENVGAPALVETFREEAVAQTRYDPGSKEDAVTDTSEQDPRLGFRRFRPPRPLEVLIDRDGPTALRGEHLAARVLVAAGPYRSTGEWWSEEVFSRDYWDVHASDGAVYRVHQERRSGSWFLDGYYD